MKAINRLLAVSIFTACAVFFTLHGGSAQAATPTMTASATGDGDSIQLNVSGDPSSLVLFYYVKTGASATLSSLGRTDVSGHFTTVISTASYGIAANSPVHVIVNNQPSVDIAWPNILAGALYLNQTGVALALGQTKTLSVYNGGTSLMYLANNSNPTIANVSISGNQATVSAVNYGATTITLCTSNTNCASAYIGVQNTGVQPLAFSQNNVSLLNSASVKIYGGTGSYVLLSNSNPANIQASLNADLVNLTTNVTTGYSAITICSSNMTSCGIINANVGSSANQAVSVSQPNPILTVGQNQGITLSGSASGIYTLFSNSNQTTVSTGLSDNTLTVNASAVGSSNLVVCSQEGSCTPISVTVLGNGSTGGKIALSQNNLWLAPGQSSAIIVSGGAMPYSVYGSYPNIATASLQNNILTITGVGGGSAAFDVCSAQGGCINLAVLINGAVVATPVVATVTPVVNFSLSQSAITLSVGQAATVAITGSGIYSLAENSSPVTVVANIADKGVTVSGTNPGQATVKVCQSTGQCANLTVTVVTTPVVKTDDKTVVATKPVAKPVVKVVKYKFTRALAFGNSNKDVIELQKLLAKEGLFKGAANGRYLNTTVVAVRKYQQKHKLKLTGNVGPQTMTQLNK